MGVIIIKIGIIGAGKVGFSLGKYLKENKLTVTGYFSKNEESAYEASKFTATKKYTLLCDLINESDTILITTPDDSIQQVWNQIKTMSIKNKIICHCSGSLSSDIFSNIDQYGAFGYSIHPMFSISDKYNSYKFLRKAFITIEGEEQNIYKINNLIKSFGNSTIIIKRENKALYHAATVMVSNLVLGLINNGVSCLKQCGFQSDEALSSLYPLIINNIENIEKYGFENSLTGPLERNDVETIRKHYQVLDERDKELYKLLSLSILNIAKKKNKSRDYSQIELFVGGEL